MDGAAAIDELGVCGVCRPHRAGRAYGASAFCMAALVSEQPVSIEITTVANIGFTDSFLSPLTRVQLHIYLSFNMFIHSRPTADT